MMIDEFDWFVRIVESVRSEAKVFFVDAIATTEKFERLVDDLNWFRGGGALDTHGDALCASRGSIISRL
ncbi:hypothetical protein Sjap_010852 [Stephania japonica]|uniref:Uncharacterized protein n=1 Tax=Stephania japonica TaxID=461633 RepID=A0AAP0JC21_9MAGN